MRKSFSGHAYIGRVAKCLHAAHRGEGSRGNLHVRCATSGDTCALIKDKALRRIYSALRGLAARAQRARSGGVLDQCAQPRQLHPPAQHQPAARCLRGAHGLHPVRNASALPSSALSPAKRLHCYLVEIMSACTTERVLCRVSASC